MSDNPLLDIHTTERSVAATIAAAEEAATAGLAEARRTAETLVGEARARGTATAKRRYEEGLARARDEGDRIRSGADERAASLRRRAETHVPAAVDLVMDTVLPSPGED
jgi:vacuolar-type H+-ATPase subunit H